MVKKCFVQLFVNSTKLHKISKFCDSVLIICTLKRRASIEEILTLPPHLKTQRTQRKAVNKLKRTHTKWYIKCVRDLVPACMWTREITSEQLDFLQRRRIRYLPCNVGSPTFSLPRRRGCRLGRLHRFFISLPSQSAEKDETAIRVLMKNLILRKSATLRDYLELD